MGCSESKVRRIHIDQSNGNISNSVKFLPITKGNEEIVSSKKQSALINTTPAPAFFDTTVTADDLHVEEVDEVEERSTTSLERVSHGEPMSAGNISFKIEEDIKRRSISQIFRVFERKH